MPNKLNNAGTVLTKSSDRPMMKNTGEISRDGKLKWKNGRKHTLIIIFPIPMNTVDS